MTQRLKLGLASFAIAIGLLMVVCAWGLISLTANLIHGTVLAHASGAPAELFRHYIIGLLSGGTVLAAPYWLICTIAMSGCLLMYLGVFVLVNRHHDRGLGSLLTRSFWLDFHQSLCLRSAVKKGG